MNHSKAPLLEQLILHHRKKTVSFHVPGHKAGRTYTDEMISPYYSSLLPLDLTEITGLDDLHQPEGVILEAQALAADLVGADQSFFLVGGSTVGNIALILAVCNPGDTIIVHRDVHKSVIHGLMLARAKAVFIASEFDPVFGVPCGVRIKDLQLALEKYPQAKAVFLTNPNYYGLGQELKSIITLVHEHGLPVFVDEAHGAHYGFHPRLPSSALSQGADAVVQSPHKMLTAMTMSGLLHLKGERVNGEKVQRKLSMIQSSSPSYPILASIDWTRKYMAEHGYDQLTKGLDAIQYFRENMRSLNCFLLNSEKIAAPFTQDPFKIIIQDKTGTLDGKTLLHELEKRGCYMELFQPHFVLAVFTLTSTKADAEQLYFCLKDIQEQYDLTHKSTSKQQNSKCNVRFKLHEKLSSANFDHLNDEGMKNVTLDEAVGYRSAQMITPYPPGIPMLFPGEWITEEKVSELKRCIRSNVRIEGMKTNESIMKIKVL